MMMAPARNGSTRTSTKLPDRLDLGRLCDVITRDRRELEPFRRNRLEMVRQYAGGRYGVEAAAAEVPVNLLGLYAEVITQALVDNAPRVMLSTFDQGQRTVVDAMEQWANDELVRSGVAETFKRAVYDALFCVGIVKVALATPADAAAEAWDVKAGEPFVESVDLDDFACDTTSRTFARCSYHACRYRLSVDLANELYAKGKAEKFLESPRDDINFGGDDRIHTLGGSGGRRDELEDSCDLWEVYLPRDKLIVTLRDSAGIPDSSRGPVRVQPWVGPSSGPYHFLAFGLVPGNLMPKAPVMDLYDLHRHYNAAYRKLMRRTRDAKAVTCFDGSDTDDAERMRKASDGEMVQARNPDRIKTIETGGPTNDLIVMTDHIKSMFSFKGGNLELLGGRSPQARTAAQDKMLNENAGAGIGALSSAFHTFVQGTIESLLWYYHHHPTKVMQSHYSPPSYPAVRAVRQVRPEQRMGSVPQVRIDPYSLPMKNPGARLSFITQTLTTLAPMMPLLMQQGKTPDMDAILKLFAKYGDEPDITTIFGLNVSPQGTGGGVGSEEQQQPGGMPAQTTRTYERYSSGGQGPAAAQQQLDTNVSRMQGPANPNSGGT